MKKILLFILFLFPVIAFSNSFNGLENLTQEERESKLSACKKLKQDGKLSELTAQDFSLCNELISKDLIISYEDKTQIERKKEENFDKKELVLDEKAIRFIKEAMAKGADYKQITEFLQGKGYAYNEIIDYKKQLDEEIENKEKLAYWRNKIIETLLSIVGVFVLLLCFWLFFFKILPKMIYVLRKAWLQAAEDAKNKVEK